MTYVGTYTVAGLRCSNCRWSQSSPSSVRLDIPCGQRVTETPCPVCGCKTLSTWVLR